MTKLSLKNGNIMVRIDDESKHETTTAAGIIIPQEKLEEDQVSKGTIVAVADELSEEYKVGSGVFFHKFNPTDVHMKYDSDELEEFWFIKSTDVICVYSND